VCYKIVKIGSLRKDSMLIVSWVLMDDCAQCANGV
jgi:hypothetical protein